MGLAAYHEFLRSAHGESIEEALLTHAEKMLFVVKISRRSAQPPQIAGAASALLLQK